MAYYTGNFSSFAALKNSVETALQANGWVLNGDGVLEKNGMYLRLTATTAELLLRAGTGSAAGALTGAAPNGVKIMDFTGSPMSFPATYDLHVYAGPDEVFLVVNYNGDKYQQLSWGKSNVQQIGGTGMWFSGSFQGSAASSQNHLVYTNADASYFGFVGPGIGMGCGLFAEDYGLASGCSYVHTGLDTTAWRRVGSGNGNLVGSGDLVAGLLQALPSTFNQNTVLLPLLVAQRRPSKGQTIVVDMVNARLCRNDNHLSGEIVEYGPDKWKVYPFHRKNADVRNGVAWSTGANHSGTFAYAIRYTGP